MQSPCHESVYNINLYISLQQIDLAGLGFSQDYYPYVFFRVNLDVLEK